MDMEMYREAEVFWWSCVFCDRPVGIVPHLLLLVFVSWLCIPWLSDTHLPLGSPANVVALSKRIQAQPSSSVQQSDGFDEKSCEKVEEMRGTSLPAFPPVFK
jgi:hypothetical protein